MSIGEIDKKDSEDREWVCEPDEEVVAAQQLSKTICATDEQLLASNGRTFHFAARFLPAKQRRQVIALYAFFRMLDDLVDKPPQGHTAEDIRIELERWRCWFMKRYAFPAPQEALGARLAAVLVEHRVPNTFFLEFLDGLTSDLEFCEMRDFGELYRYCYRVAGTVGLSMAYVLESTSPQALAAAESLGIGMQLTNILRDVGGDLATGRIYLPQDELAHFGCSREHLFQLYRDRRVPDERFCALMRYQVGRAHRYYVHGMSGIWLLPADCRLPILLAGRLYRRILTVIERKHYDVLRARAATSLSEKMRETAIAFTLDLLWRRGEAGAYTRAEGFLED